MAPITRRISKEIIMASASLPPPTMDWLSSDLDSAMRKFLHSCNLHFNGPLEDLAKVVQINYLLIWAGSEGQDIADTFTFTTPEQDTLQSYISKFENYVKPRSNFRVARYRLLGFSQQPGQAVDVYMKCLKEVISQCDYDVAVSTTLLVDIFIFGLHLKSVWAVLTEEKDLTAEKALQVAAYMRQHGSKVTLYAVTEIKN